MFKFVVYGEKWGLSPQLEEVNGGDPILSVARELILHCSFKIIFSRNT